jgi:hypothetical protein
MDKLALAGVMDATRWMPRRSWQLIRPHDDVPQFSAGDVIFRAGNQHIMSVLISCVQFLRPDTRGQARWNHVMLVLDGDRVAHATGNGLMEGKLDVLENKTYALVRFDCSDESRRQMVTFADFRLRKNETWGRLTAFSQLIAMLTGSRLAFGTLGTVTCSGFAASALVRAGANFDRPAPLLSPAELARECGLPGPVRAGDVAATARRLAARITRDRDRS